MDKDILQHKTSRIPSVLWIELTSKCTVNCIFCSRKTLRGTGMHMDPKLFQSIIRDLEEPEIIRLNYSGESLLYPQLADAVELAAGTGATTELVSALVGINSKQIPSLARSRLDRLTVSLHAITPEIFQSIYRVGGIEEVKENIEAILEIKAKEKTVGLMLDMAFVAMKQNIGELEKVAAYAYSIGIRELSIHPVIRRDEILETFEAELKNGRLRNSFKTELSSAVENIRNEYPELNLNLSTPEIDAENRLTSTPSYYTDILPKGGRIHTCDQNPWETVHILADGNVVVCECIDNKTMGCIEPGRSNCSLLHIWQSQHYNDFRKYYYSGKEKNCRECSYKMVYRPESLKSRISPDENSRNQLIKGWYFDEGSPDIIWSKKYSSAVLKQTMGKRTLHIKGILPPGPPQEPNHLRLQVRGKVLKIILNSTNDYLSFDTSFPIDRVIFRTKLIIDLESRFAFRPCENGHGADTRKLGFALIEFETK